jgi:molybdopterin converting factor small subunit
MSAVRIPPVLRTATGGQKLVQVAGDTVGQVLSSLASAYPSLATQVLTPDGDINRFVNVYLNDTDVRHLQALSTPVDERDTLLLLPAMAGGCACASRGGAGASSPCAGLCSCCAATDTCACPERALAG